MIRKHNKPSKIMYNDILAWLRNSQVVESVLIAVQTKVINFIIGRTNIIADINGGLIVLRLVSITQSIFFARRLYIWIKILYRNANFARLAKEMGVTWSICTFHNWLLISSQGDAVKAVWKQSCKSFVPREIIINQWSYNIHQTPYAIFSLFTLFVKQNLVEQYLLFSLQNMFTRNFLCFGWY